LEGANVLS